MWMRPWTLPPNARPFPNVGVCLQAYLFRTRDDLSKLLTLRPSIRLVKGATTNQPRLRFPASKMLMKIILPLQRRCSSRKKETGACARPSGRTIWC